MVSHRPYVSKGLKECLTWKTNYKCGGGVYGVKCPMKGKMFADRAEYHFDHIVPLWFGGETEYDNMQTLCLHCHKEKTKREATVRSVWKKTHLNNYLRFGEFIAAVDYRTLRFGYFMNGDVAMGC